MLVFAGRASALNSPLVSVSAQAVGSLGQDISGTYALHDKCGHAANGLHKRLGCPPEENDMFFFLDPSRCGGPETDHYVFAASHHR